MTTNISLDIPRYEVLLNNQQKLQDNADWVLEQINLIQLLSKYGEVKIVGAKALGLMVARDIDISILVPEINIKIWQQIVNQLMITKNVRKVTAVDEYYYDDKNIYNLYNGKKYSLYIEMDSLLGPDQDKHNPWEIQIHLITVDKFDKTILENIKSKLDEKTRLTILKLKWWANQVNRELLYKSCGHFKIHSVWIYEAVLNNEISEISELINYLKNKMDINEEYADLLKRSLA